VVVSDIGKGGQCLGLRIVVMPFLLTLLPLVEFLFSVLCITNDISVSAILYC
jgi:hypothetical protein